MKILVVEDDVEVSQFISKGLTEAGYVVDLAHDGREGLYLATGEDYDLIILDRMLPKIDGLNILKTLRSNEDQTPVLMLSALADVDHRIEGLKAGGDDYVTKPFSISELIIRVQVLLKRQKSAVTENSLKVADLELDLMRRQARRGNVEIDLKTKEFQLLEYFMRNERQVITRTMILEHVWDYNFDPQTNVIDVHVSRLRRKIDDGQEVKLLHTIRGAGYMIGEKN